MKDGQTALVLAVRSQHWDVASKLIDAGATNLDATDEVSLSCVLKLKVRLLN